MVKQEHRSKIKPRDFVPVIAAFCVIGLAIVVPLVIEMFIS